MNDNLKQNRDKIYDWRKDVFSFCKETMRMKPAEPIEELLGKPIMYKDSFGIERTTVFFDVDGRLVYPDLSFYTIDMFKNQTRSAFGKYIGTRFTWQETVALEAYNRGINTFYKDSYNEVLRWISIRSGHGTGKTSVLSIIALHFLICFFGSQVGVTANTEQQLKDIFLKELYYWRSRLPEQMRGNVEQLDDTVRIDMAKDWFLRARVARQEKPEALAGLHGEYVLIIVDEASGVHDRIFEVMKGALTGINFIVIYTSNPTRTEGEFYETQKTKKKGNHYTRLHFNSRHSPIVQEGYIARMETENPSAQCSWLDKGYCTLECRHSDEVRIRVDGEFAGEDEMDDKGWIPLFANITILFEPEHGQVISRAIVGVDPAGKGRDHSIIHVRDNIYLKEVLNEGTSSSPDLARKVETVRDAYNSTSSDIAVEAFGIGAEVIANIQTKLNDPVNAILTDKPREEVKDKYHTFRSELGWRFREWVSRGGIIITNKSKAWINEMEKIKYKRDGQGRIMLMDKVAFKKEYRFSPDRFDAACMTFFKDEPFMPVVLTSAQLEEKETAEWLRRAQAKQNETNKNPNFSSM